MNEFFFLFRYNESKSNYIELFNMKGLMRIRLTPDLSKLMICTTNGSILVIHDLDLRHLAKDLEEFRVSFVLFFL